jgi:RNA polymerase sigma-70 factor (ECF subfamily)
MTQFAQSSFAGLLRLARAGDQEALGRLLQACRSYLKLLARLQIDRRLQGKVDPSDVVQETFLQAYRGWGTFAGSAEDELLAWLRAILAARMAKVIRGFVKTQRRDVRLERQLGDELDRSSQTFQTLASPQGSPSQKLVRREQALTLANALEQLPPDHREVIILRQLEELSFPAVAERMGRSPDAARKLWIRALAALRHQLGGQANGPH